MTQSFSDELKNFMFERGRTNTVLAGLESSSMECDALKLTVTMTFGAAEYSAGESMHETVRHADMALLQGKNSGRNQMVVFEGS
jgi:PleD family two-component response regulator